MKKFIDKFEKLEIHHRIIVFVSLICLTIVVTRIGIYIHISDFDPKLFGFELHHFDYGVSLLIFSAILMLFERKRSWLQLPLIAVAIGLILDELWFIRENVIDFGRGQVDIYNNSLSSVIVLVIFVTLLVVLVNRFLGTKK